jgi:hypothetical protein
MTNKPNARQLLNDDPIRFSLLKSGAVYDRDAGRIVTHTGEGPFQITKESSGQMRTRWKQKTLIAQLRGLAAKEGVELPPDITDEEIVQGALSGVEALTAHMKAIFLKSNNIRGLAEAYSKLVSPLTGQPDDDDSLTDLEVREVYRDLAALARRVMGGVEANRQRQVINGDVLDVTE